MRFSMAAGLGDLAAFPPQQPELNIPVPQNYSLLFTPLPLTPDSRFLIGKDQVEFVYVSPGLCAIIGTQEHILKKKNVKQL